jgi:hypothetical protein
MMRIGFIATDEAGGLLGVATSSLSGSDLLVGLGGLTGRGG